MSKHNWPTFACLNVYIATDCELGLGFESMADDKQGSIAEAEVIIRATAVFNSQGATRLLYDHAWDLHLDHPIVKTFDWEENFPPDPPDNEGDMIFAYHHLDSDEEFERRLDMEPLKGCVQLSERLNWR
jgi:hypothetical protein